MIKHAEAERGDEDQDVKFTAEPVQEEPVEEEEWTESFVATTDNFYGTVVDRDTSMLIGDKPWFIEFYAPWCPHCQHLAPKWDELHNLVKKDVNVARVDCTAAGKVLCTEFAIRGYPTLLYFPEGGSVYHTYKGQRTVEAFQEWLEMEGWRQVQAQAIGTNASVFDDMMPAANAVLASLKDTFLT